LDKLSIGDTLLGELGNSKFVNYLAKLLIRIQRCGTENHPTSSAKVLWALKNILVPVSASTF